MTFIALALAAFAGSAQADYSLSTCRQLVANGEKYVEMTKDRFNVGELNRSDVALVELAQLDLRYECRDILAADYCQAAQPLAQSVLDGLRELSRVGQVSTAEILVAENRLIKIQGACR